MWSDVDYSEVATKVATFGWRVLLERAQNGERLAVADCLGSDHSPEACLVRGALVYESDPAEGKHFFAIAARASDPYVADQARIYEAKACEFLGQQDEGRKLIRDLLKRNLDPRLKYHALIVSAGLHIHAPKRALRALDKINVNALSLGMAGRFYTVRGRAFRYLGEYDKALIAYAGAVAFYEQAGHVHGIAHASNNLAWVYRSLKRFSEAHDAADRAISIVGYEDPFVAQFLDTKAQIFLNEKEFNKAEVVALRALRMVQESGRRGVLCEHFCTLGRAYAGQEKYGLAVSAYVDAAALAEELDDPELLFKAISGCKEMAQKFVRESDLKLAELAMRMDGFSSRAAAKKLGITRQGLQKLLARNSRKWQPKLPQTSICKPLK